MNLLNFKCFKLKKSISPLIATILLVVVVVVLVTVVLNWGKDVSQQSLGQVDKIRTYEKSDIKYYTYFDSSDNMHGSVYMSWDPPAGQRDQDINLIGFRIVDDEDMPIYYVDEPYHLKIGANLMPLGIVDDDFDLALYFDNNTMFIKEDLHMNLPVNLSVSDCPDGYVSVPANSLYGTSSFCVMKYEAKIDETGDGIGDTNTDCNCNSTIFSWKYYNGCPYTENNREIVSSVEGYPLAYISQTEAKAACDSIGEGYHLITNEEWMTIARNIERQPENWTGGQVGSGSLYTGSTGGCIISSACYNSSDSRTDPDYGIGRDESAKLVLSNGSEVWDLSGNMWEWVDKTIDVSQAGNLPHDSDLILDWDWIEFSEGVDGWSGGVLDDLGLLDIKDLLPLDTGLNSNRGIGRIYTDESYTSGTDRTIRRGGDWASGTNASPFTVNLRSTPNYRSRGYGYGFRCSIVPS